MLNFDISKIATFTEKDIESLLRNPGIIRMRGKIDSDHSQCKTSS